MKTLDPICTIKPDKSMASVLALFACFAFVLAPISMAAQAAGDTFTIMLTTTDNRPFAMITAQPPAPAAGKERPAPFTTTMLVDPGATVGFGFDITSEFAKYLMGGKDVKFKGVGGEKDGKEDATIAAAMQASLGFTPAPTVPPRQAAKQPNFPTMFDSLPLPRKGQGTIGSGYTSTFASYAVNNRAGKPVSLVLNTAAQIGFGRPNGTDSEVAMYIPPSNFPDGNPDYNSGVFTVPVAVASGEGCCTVIANFVIDPGVTTSLITHSLAVDLGIDPDLLPMSLYSTDLGSFIAPYASVSFSLFPGDPDFPGFSSANVAIADETNDPDGINLLGSDILSQLSYWEVDPGSYRFYAAAAN